MSYPCQVVRRRVLGAAILLVFMHFLSSKTVAVAAAASSVRLPRPATSCTGLNLAALNPKGARAALATSATDQRARHRADQSRYQAKCRMAMAF